MTEISHAALIATFAAGTISFLSPCVLPLVPGYISYIAGQAIASGTTPRTAMLRARTIALSLCFVLGFSTIFVILGASATALGQLLISYRYELNLVGGSIVIIFGLFTIGLLRPAWLLRDLRIHTAPARGQPMAAYLLGMAFAFGWTPCIGPVLGSILTVSAASATVAKGVAFLAVYSAGLGVPFMITAAFTDGLLARLNSIGRIGRIPQMLTGAVMVVIGAAMITGHLPSLSYWLLDAIPILRSIG
ncbi:MAG TPA: cytochrome c biogenesis protein CcdA [Gemmataceae bacterium]|nr:cytochrome c biogenesis protein CcdA [Gemmataceae bacterium]